MIEKFYDKIHTIFDGLADDQRVTIYNQLGEKLMKDNLLPIQTSSTPHYVSKPKKARGWRPSGHVSFKHLTGFDPKKTMIARIEGTMVKDYMKVDEGELIIIMKDKKYAVCVRDNSKSKEDFLFEGDFHNGLIYKSPKFNSPITETNWKDLNRWCDKHFNK